MLMRVSEVSKTLGLEESTIRKWIFMQRIPVVKIGRSVRVRKEDVEALIKDGYRPTVGEGVVIEVFISNGKPDYSRKSVFNDIFKTPLFHYLRNAQ